MKSDFDLQCLEVIPLEDEAFAVAPGAGILFHLNPSARGIIESLQAGASGKDIAQAIAETGSVTASRAARDIETLTNGIADEYRTAQSAGPRPPDPAPPLPEHVAHATYRLFERFVLVRFPNQDTAAACHPPLAPLQAPAGTRHDLMVTFQEVGEEYLVTCGAAKLSVHRTAWAALSALQRVILFHDRPDPGLFGVVMHAGAIVGPRGAWLIGGDSGHGKSTLVARLDASGHTVLGDDLIPLDLEERLAFPLPRALSIKESGWGVVSTFRPEISSARPYVTAIGKHVRYLAPLTPPRDADRQGHPVAGLLLPKRREGAAPAIRPIGLKRAMIALCDRFGRFPIEPADLRGLIALIAGLPRHELVYDDAGEILPKLAKLL